MTNGEYADEQMQRGGPLSRKKFLAGSAALLGGGALAAALPKAARAHSTPEPPTDIDVLNYALTLEHLEYAFYRDGLKRFDQLDFRRFFGPGRGLPPKAGLLDVAGSKVYNYFMLILDHEDTHVDTLTSVITDLGGKPVPEATYNFRSTAFTSLKKFIAVAQFLENTGVTAYDGAIAHIEAAALLRAGATIATVEARHASYLNLLNGVVGFPDTFDTPVAPRDICEAVKAENDGFIVSTPRPYGPYESLDALCARLPTTTTP
ncbi:MAG: ferritin-like domain-containing protein [Rubrobacter sp.]